MMTRSSDTLITAKVKTRLFGIKGLDDFDATRVKVVTDDDGNKLRIAASGAELKTG